jgi:hypothetical protein
MSATASATAARPRNRIADAKAQFTIFALWRLFGLRGEPGSPCRCPFREDFSANFSVSEDGRRWIDFATGNRGDVVDFLAQIRGVSTPEALLELLKLAEGTMPDATAPGREPEVKTSTPSQPLLPGLEIELEGGVGK